MKEKGRTYAEMALAGSDPNDASSAFALKIQIDGNVPKVTMIPDLGESRTYVLEGKTNLSDEKWEPKDESKHRFFRARTRAVASAFVARFLV